MIKTSKESCILKCQWCSLAELWRIMQVKFHCFVLTISLAREREREFHSLPLRLLCLFQSLMRKPPKKEKSMTSYLISLDSIRIKIKKRKRNIHKSTHRKLSDQWHHIWCAAIIMSWMGMIILLFDQTFSQHTASDAVNLFLAVGVMSSTGTSIKE